MPVSVGESWGLEEPLTRREVRVWLGAANFLGGPDILDEFIHFCVLSSLPLLFTPTPGSFLKGELKVSRSQK